MKIIEQSIMFEEGIDGEAIIRKIERAAKTCYRAEHRVGSLTDAQAFVRSLITRGHESTIEHVSVSARVITNRRVSHQWVRHRVGCSYSQESTRYCNYNREKFGNEIVVIWPWFLGDYTDGSQAVTEGTEHPSVTAWMKAMVTAENWYMRLTDMGLSAEEASDALPMAVKTEFVVTMTLRAWRHFFKERCSKRAHPQIRDLALQALRKLDNAIPAVFEDLRKEFDSEEAGVNCHVGTCTGCTGSCS